MLLETPAKNLCVIAHSHLVSVGFVVGLGPNPLGDFTRSDRFQRVYIDDLNARAFRRRPLRHLILGEESRDGPPH